MKEDYNDKDQKIFISWTREEISHVIGNMNINQDDQNGNGDILLENKQCHVTGSM